ncbi:hypothetical protein RVV18_001999 [Burkholderia ambifaria]|uniref:hypothetical protein n=1 Tax=Burkholderia ambifaria TaxID=152480 RepID=UPI000059BDB8|nr:hypothetical protein [Burkholderia ambifaria]ELK6206576.1 hypothetical protein [Burkholderia ambifaria]MBR7929615.1 hypothetical protein [Burkholderia ambifaria]MBR8347301.1 hypothetical protein [Burkholderia ambifaria]QQC02917.1 hypothetical protein I6H84_08895 [Burkholderia ambifaria]UZU06328.1 hypothetical protein OR987_23315 [Burkholderia ambifaria]
MDVVRIEPALCRVHQPSRAARRARRVRQSVWTDDRKWVTCAQLIAWHAAAIEALESYRARFPGKTENIQMRKREVAMLEGALDEYDQKGSTQ